jgi:hypothetical protein
MMSAATREQEKVQFPKTRRKVILRSILLNSGILLVLLVSSTTQVLPLSEYPQALNTDETLKTAADKGKAALEALRSYTYYAELTLQTVSEADTITGEYYHFTRISFEPDGSRRETLLENKSNSGLSVYADSGGPGDL